MPGKQKNIIAREPVMINVHQVCGNLLGIEYLKLGGCNTIDGIFLRAKIKGKCEFRYRGSRYVISYRRDMTFYVEEKAEQISKYDSL